LDSRVIYHARGDEERIQRRRWEDNIKLGLKEIVSEVVKWSYFYQDNETSFFMKCGKWFDKLSNCQLLKKSPLPWVSSLASILFAV